VTDAQAKVELLEVAPRDGLQNDPADLPTASKAEIVARVARAGIGRVEATSFVSARAVPKLADAEEVVERVRTELGDAVRLIGLVVNERGVQRAAQAGVHEVNLVVVATDALSRANQGASVAEVLAALPRLVELARSLGLGTSVTIGAAFGCPYEGEVPLARLHDVAVRVLEAQPDELCLADTIGVAVPAEVDRRVRAVQEIAGETRLRCHFHDTRSTGTANAWSAHRAGVSVFDASLGGIGGCPFAPGASGNVATENLAYLFERSGVATGVDIDALLEASEWLAGELHRGPTSALARAGWFPGRARGS
jgi:hydroxymethylglutaryl-CoA lyase